MIWTSSVCTLSGWCAGISGEASYREKRCCNALLQHDIYSMAVCLNITVRYGDQGLSEKPHLYVREPINEDSSEIWVCPKSPE